MDNFWHSIETLIENSVIPNCIKTILFNSGYDTSLAIASINEGCVVEIENYINANGNFIEIVKDLQCCHSELYKDGVRRKTFRFLPGLKNLIIKIAEIVANSTTQNERNSQSQLERLMKEIQCQPALPEILKEVVRTALENSQKAPNLNRYPDTLKYFAIYVYLLCGRQCYEILCNNLAMPAASTIGNNSHI